MREQERNPKGAEIKTYPVPFTSGEIKKNISISTHNSSQPSKEQIINQAFKFHATGNISEAAKLYQYFIDQGFKNHIVFSNFGTLLNSLGKLKEAVLYLRKAIEIKPDFAEAHYNLGNLLRDLGKLQEAELSLRKSIELNSDLINAYTSLGKVLKDLDEL